MTRLVSKKRAAIEKLLFICTVVPIHEAGCVCKSNESGQIMDAKCVLLRNTFRNAADTAKRYLTGHPESP